MQETISVAFEIEGSSSGKMRNDFSVTMVSPTKGTYQLATDEGPMHGGEDTAPPPLALFLAGLCGCLMTQVRAFGKRLGVPVTAVSVRGNADWLAHLTGRGPYTAESKDVGMEIHIDSPATDGEVRELIEAAIGGCFIESMLRNPPKVRHTVTHGADTFEL